MTTSKQTKEQQILAKINQRERQILVHAYLYYKNNQNLISDDKYDQWSFELADLIKTYPGFRLLSHSRKIS